MAKRFSQVLDVDCFQKFAPTPSSPSVEILAAVANRHGWCKDFSSRRHTSFYSCETRCRDIYDMKLPGECGDMSGKIVRLNRSLYGLKRSGRIIGRDRGRVRYGAG